jgi:hypothetical protein
LPLLYLQYSRNKSTAIVRSAMVGLGVIGLSALSRHPLEMDKPHFYLNWLKTVFFAFFRDKVPLN